MIHGLAATDNCVDRPRRIPVDAIAAGMSASARRITLLLLTLIYGFGFVDRVVIALVAQALNFHLSQRT